MDGLTDTTTVPVVCLYLLLASPLAAIAALWMTGGRNGWARRLAVSVAGFVVAFTLVMAVIFARLAWLNR